MTKKIILTSFQTWLPHQSSNSSDDLLVIGQKENTDTNITFLRQVPVDTAAASERTCAAIKTLTPDLIICCGMAESRYQLTVESNATHSNNKLETVIDLPSLVSQLSYTAISHNAGKFVCEGLYYQVLQHLKEHNSETPCLFVHVPILTATNTAKILTDFRLILDKANHLVISK